MIEVSSHIRFECKRQVPAKPREGFGPIKMSWCEAQNPLALVPVKQTCSLLREQ